MDFAIIAETFQKMEATTKRTELTSLLVELIKNTPNELIATLGSRVEIRF